VLQYSCSRGSSLDYELSYIHQISL
jgi:hypothetical protein